MKVYKAFLEPKKFIYPMSLVEDKHYFIMSPKDVVMGKPRDQGGGCSVISATESFLKGSGDDFKIYIRQ